MIERLDVRFRDLHEFLVREIGEQHVARQSEIGAIELQVEARRGDGSYSSRMASARAAR